MTVNTFCAWLLLLLIALKLTHYIDWSWWWVASPAWISLLLHCLLVLMIALSPPDGRK